MKNLQTFKEFLNENLNEAKVVISFNDEKTLKKAMDDATALSRSWQINIKPDKKGTYDGEDVPYAIEVSGAVNDLVDFVNVKVEDIGGTPVWTDSRKISDLF